MEPPVVDDEPSQNTNASQPASKSRRTVASRASSLLALHVAAVIWGTQHAVIKTVVVGNTTPGVINAVRFGVAAAVSLPFADAQLWHCIKLRRSSTPAEVAAAATAASVWRAGGELGMLTFLGFSLQSFGLLFTTAGRSAFLLYLNVKFVPLLGFFFFGRIVTPTAWASAAIAFAGTACIAFDGSPPNIGDAWSLAAAAASAIFILRLEDAAATTQLSSASLNAATISSAALLCTAWTLVEPHASGGGTSTSVIQLLREQWVPMLYLALVPTVLGNGLQTFGQRKVRAQDAAVIFALDPVYGAAFAWLLRSEVLGTNGYVGVALVLGAVLLSYSQNRTASTDSAFAAGPEGWELLASPAAADHVVEDHVIEEHVEAEATGHDADGVV